eukprot:gene5870-6111_t
MPSKLQAADYTSYAKHLTSWGFAVVLYGLPLLHVVDDQVEVGFLPYLLHHVEQQPEVWGLLDSSRIAAAGHSRGGKLAALHLAGSPEVVTAFLIDPVDSSAFRPPTPENPSAVEMLRGLNKSAGIAGIDSPMYLCAVLATPKALLVPSNNLEEASAATASGMDPLYAEILQLHNTYRARHCAAPLEWSARLAREAADYAKLCKLQHDPDIDAGENLYAMTWAEDGAQRLREAISMWYDEVADYKYSQPGFSSKTGHFTQVVWAETSQLGCAVHLCSEGLGGLVSWPAGALVVCRYMDSGNWRGFYEENVLPPSCGLSTPPTNSTSPSPPPPTSPSPPPPSSSPPPPPYPKIPDSGLVSPSPDPGSNNSTDGPPPPSNLTSKAPVDCQGFWNVTSPCNAICGGGYQSARFTITVPAANGGAGCERDDGSGLISRCNIQACPRVTVLAAGKSVASPSCKNSRNKRFKLCVQNDGRMVLYRGTASIWASSGSGRSGTPVTLSMQLDGDLVLTNRSKRKLWRSNTATPRSGSRSLVILDNGSLAIAAGTGDNVVWQTGPARP